jgi:hypothetical protein
VQIEGNPVALEPNVLGNYPRTYVAANAHLPIEIAYPDAEPGEVVGLEVEDGGKLDNQKIGQAVKIGEDRQLRFGFQVNDEVGIYRVVLRRGGDQKMLEFWVGPENPIVARNPKS